MKKFLLLLVFLTFYPLVNYAGLYDEVKEKIDANKQVIDSSKGKNIVAFIGSTGAGKSTALNYINNVPLIYEDLQELIHYNDSGISEEIFKIVHGGISGTDAPKYIDNAYTETRMYDFPGWNDNRGLSHEIVSAAFY